MGQTIINAIHQVGADFAEGFTQLLPRAITAIVIVAIGWVIAMLLRAIIRFVLGWSRINAATERMGLASSLKNAGLPAANVLCGSIVFWLGTYRIPASRLRYLSGPGWLQNQNA